MNSTETISLPVGPPAIDLRVHVVTVTHNSAETLDAYFAGLADCAAEIAGVTIVDNASTDDTVERVTAAARAASTPIEVITNRNDGFAGGYFAASRSELPRDLPVLCLNPDVRLVPCAVAAVLDVLTSCPDAAIVTAPLVEMNGQPDTASRRRLPTLSTSVVYSVLGRLTPGALRYNRQEKDSKPSRLSRGGIPVSELQATTGALMLVAPDFRSLDDGIFDRDYWMYGEDLQLCADAAHAGRTVLMAEVPASVHVKGVSSGRPRSRRSNRAFHDAMTDYARKNLVSSSIALAVLRAGVEAHFVASELRAVPSRVRRRRSLRLGDERLRSADPIPS